MRFDHVLSAKRDELFETAIKGWNMHSDVHVPDMSKVGSWVKNDGHLLDFFDLNWV